MNNNKYVYLIECGNRFYKIGVATSMKKRLSGIKTGNPFPINIITKCKINNAYKLEQEIHKKLKKRKVSGEWFKLLPHEVIELCVLINSNKKQEKFLKGKQILNFAGTKIIDNHKKSWIIERENLYNNEIKPVSLSVLPDNEITTNKISNYDSLVFDAKKIILQYKKASSTLLQRKMNIGYAKAARILDTLEEMGFVGGCNGAKPRLIITEDKL